VRLAQWLARYDAELHRKFGITHHIAGLDMRDVVRQRRGFEQDPEGAAHRFGDDYNLIDLDEPWMR